MWFPIPDKPQPDKAGQASPAFRQNSERGIEMDITGIAKSHQADIPGVLADWGIGEQREFREW